MKEKRRGGGEEKEGKVVFLLAAYNKDIDGFRRLGKTFCRSGKALV